MGEYQKVRSTLEISRRIAFYLDLFEPQYLNGMSHSEMIRSINDILQGRSEQTAEAMLEELRQKSPGLAKSMELISQEIQMFQKQRDLLVVPYTESSSKQYRYRYISITPGTSLKVIDQQHFDQAAKAGFPPDFFRESYFDNVTLYCLPDHADLNFTRFSDCTFAVCRMRNAVFDGTTLYGCIFHNVDMRNTTFFNSTLANTHFRDSALTQVSFQGASLKRCNTVDCTLKSINFLNATLDGCIYGCNTATSIRNLQTAHITMGGATHAECDHNRQAIYKALQSTGTPQHKGRSAPVR